jgi:hypothetical protein
MGGLNNFGKIWMGVGGAWTVFRIATQDAPTVPFVQNKPWRPPEWDSGMQMYLMTVPQADGNGGTRDVAYYFDAVLRADHQSTVRHTEHPVQVGANVSDHAFNLPSRVILEIGMSDAMDRFVANQYTSADTKSISAFQTFKDIQVQRVPLTLSTRLFTYHNMIIESIHAMESNRTKYGLRAIITFSELFTTNIEVNKTNSARPQTTDATPKGSQTPQQPDANMLDPYTLSEEQMQNGFGVFGPGGENVIGSGNITSVPYDVVLTYP